MLRDFYFLFSSMGHKDILALFLEHWACTMEMSASVTGWTKRSVGDSCMLIDPVLIKVGQSFAPILKKLRKASHK